jgi:hypothetical protein
MASSVGLDCSIVRRKEIKSGLWAWRGLPTLRCAASAVLLILGASSAIAQSIGTPQPTDSYKRIVRAEIAALDQLLVYNRFGSFNPYGMIFALRRDVVVGYTKDSANLQEAGTPDAERCGRQLGTEYGDSLEDLVSAVTSEHPSGSAPVRLRDCKRPRPIVLRGNVGDILEIEVTNLLRRKQPDISKTWCRENRTPSTPSEVNPNRRDLAWAYLPQCLFERISDLVNLEHDLRNADRERRQAAQIDLVYDGRPDPAGEAREASFEKLIKDFDAFLRRESASKGGDASSLIDLWRQWHLADSEAARDAVAKRLQDRLELSSFDTRMKALESSAKALLEPKTDKFGQANPEKATPGRSADWPATRSLSITIPGLEPYSLNGKPVPKVCLGLDAVQPGKSFTCHFRLDREGTHVLSSLAAPAGGEGDAGSLIHGLFAAIIVEPEHSKANRSQVTEAAFSKAWAKAETTETVKAPRHARKGHLNYEANVEPVTTEGRSCRGRPVSADLPVLAMHRVCGRGEKDREILEIIHADLNAIIVPDPEAAAKLKPSSHAQSHPSAEGEDLRTENRLLAQAATPFREFSTIFHDEMKTFYPRHLDELSRFGQLSGVRDGFGINYGASGAGAMVIANRKGIGPAANCPECFYEEFFLESWANGDPALLEAFPDDPSNVHHSYLNDKTVFRAFHVGKETHVFHLHAHQWFAGNDENRGSYLDSQTIGPQQGLTFSIYQGGADRHAPDGEQKKGAWAVLGSGNRNRTPGDAIFHCHLYPHFAQGMWALWRVHDVLEDGSRVLPDGQALAGLSIHARSPLERIKARPGSVDRVTGAWLGTGPSMGPPFRRLCLCRGRPRRFCRPTVLRRRPQPPKATLSLAIPSILPGCRAIARRSRHWIWHGLMILL